jgi:hypothetical protein
MMTGVTRFVIVISRRDLMLQLRASTACALLPCLSFFCDPAPPTSARAVSPAFSTDFA